MPISATMLLADSAQVAEGKLYLLGGGWDRTLPGHPSAVAVHVRVSWDLTNRQHHLRLELLDHDGQLVEGPAPDGQPVPVRIEGDFEVGRPPGTPQGMDIGIPLAFNIAPLAVEAGRQYTWR